MEKKSPRSPITFLPSPLVYEKYKSGCAWGFIGFFDFRQGRAIKKLVSDKKSVNTCSVDNKYMKSKQSFLSKLEQKCRSIDDVVEDKNTKIKSNVTSKRIVEKGTVFKEHTTRKVPIAKTNHVELKSESSDDKTKEQRKTIKNLKKPSSKPVHDFATGHKQVIYPNLVEGPADEFKTRKQSPEKTRLRNKRDKSCKYGELKEINFHVHMNEATEAFMKQKSSDQSKSNHSNQSKQFLDALDVLHSNKDLFITLLQDPNSLTTKPVQHSKGSETENRKYESSSEASCSNDSLKGMEDTEDLDSIVLLKPGIAKGCNGRKETCQYSSPLFKEHENRIALFPSEDIRRKLKHTAELSKNVPHVLPADGKACNSACNARNATEISQRSAITNNHADAREMVESFRDIKRRKKGSNEEDCDSVTGLEAASISGNGLKNLNLSNFEHPKGIKSKLNAVSMKCLADKINHERGKMLRQHVPEYLGRIDALPSYDYLFAVRERANATAQMRNYSYCYYPNFDERKWRLEKERQNHFLQFSRDNIEVSSRIGNKGPVGQSQMSQAEPKISTDTFIRSSVLRSGSCLSSYDFSLGGEADSTFGVPRVVPHSMRHMSSCWTREHGYLESSKLVSPSENSTPACWLNSLIPRETDGLGGINEGTGHPSPVSVLEQNNIEDDVNQKNLVPQNVKQPFAQHKVKGGKLDPKMSLSSCMDGHGVVLDYVEAVMQGSGLDWEKLINKAQSSDELIGKSLYEEVEKRWNHPGGDHRLLFDYINEILVGLYQRHVTWMPFTEHKRFLTALTTDLFYEAIRCFDWHLLAEPPPTLDHFVEKELSKAKTWINFDTGTEDLVADLVDIVLQELIFEI